MTYLKRIPAIAAGLLFLFSGLGKLGDIVGFQHLIYGYGLNILQLLAPFIVLSEILIGVLLVFNVRVKEASVVSICLLLVFTSAFTYGWLQNGITDCGCFGPYLPFQSSPLLTYVRNVILLCLLVWSYYNCVDQYETIAQWKKITLCTIMFSSTFVAGMTYKPFAFIKRVHPYVNQSVRNTEMQPYVTNQGKSELIMFLSYSCPHCVNSMENFKAWGDNHAVEKTTAYIAVSPDDEHLDSLRILFNQRFPSVLVSEVSREEISFVEAFPTSFVIKTDTIRNVLIGELPSHYLYSIE